MKKTNILRVTALILVAVMCFSLAACSRLCNLGIVENVEVELGDSDRFSQQELEDAVECVKDYFKINFVNCELLSISYDKYQSDNNIEGYLNRGPGATNGSTYENTISLSSDFVTYDVGSDTGLEPNADYSYWNWTLIRSSRHGHWHVIECGY